MDAIECIVTRRSIRQFLDLPVDQETMLSVIEAGSHAPSCGNLQDWKFILIDDKSLMKKISEYCLGQSSVHNAAFLVVACSDPEQTQRHYGLRGERLYSVQNCAAACQNMMLAGHALGLGSSWVGAFDEIKMRSLLNIPSSVRPQAILAFGYPSEVPPEKRLKDLSIITFFNSYGSRVKNPHRVLKDYHVDWEKRITGTKTAFARLREKAIEGVQEAAAKAKEGNSSLLKRFQPK